MPSFIPFTGTHFLREQVNRAIVAAFSSFAECFYNTSVGRVNIFTCIKNKCIPMKYWLLVFPPFALLSPRKVLLLLVLAWMGTHGFAQQSNKSKSKDRYREKEQPPRAAVEQQMEQWVPLRRLAEEQLPRVLDGVSEAAVHSGLSAAAVGRCYAYALLAAHETVARYSTRVPSLRGAVSGLPPMLAFAPADSVFSPFAALFAALEVTISLMPEKEGLLQQQQELEALFAERGLTVEYAVPSKRAAREIAQRVVYFAQSNPAAQRLLLQDGDPVGWANPTPEQLGEGSRYRLFVREVFERGGTNASQEHRSQVDAWIGQTSLAARWMSISAAVCARQGMSFVPMLRTLTAVGLAMADAYAVCIGEAPQYARSSPQQVIRTLHDPSWQPLSPEAAESSCPREDGLVSAAAAAVLSHFIGERVAFQSGGRTYASFREAAREAAMARFYAGHQLRDAVEAGLVSGEYLGGLVVQRWPKEP